MVVSVKGNGLKTLDPSVCSCCGVIRRKLNVLDTDWDHEQNESSNEHEPVGLHGFWASIKTSSIEISPSKLVPTTPSNPTFK